MGAMKQYMMDLADKSGKEFDEVTQFDIEADMYKKAQEICWDDNSTYEELNKIKPFLPIKPYGEVKYYDSEEGSPKFKRGDILMAGDTFYLVK